MDIDIQPRGRGRGDVSMAYLSVHMTISLFEMSDMSVR